MLFVPADVKKKLLHSGNLTILSNFLFLCKNTSQKTKSKNSWGLELKSIGLH